MQGNRSLKGVTHVIVDEVHERSLLVSWFSLTELWEKAWDGTP